MKVSQCCKSSVMNSFLLELPPTPVQPPKLVGTISWLLYLLLDLLILDVLLLDALILEAILLDVLQLDILLLDILLLNINR